MHVKQQYKCLLQVNGGHKKKTLSASICAISTLLCLSGLATKGLAQPTEDPAVQEITVSGTRIQRSGFDSPNAVTVVGSEQMEDLGISDVGALIGQIPSNNAQMSAVNTSVGSINDYVTDSNIGAQVANLRGMNPFFGTRTLTLVDGHRFVPSTSSGSVDLSVVPAILFDRTEVVTGGASAAYGSDAVSGVVNIVLDHDLEGVKTQLDYGQTMEGDGEEYTVGLAMGKSVMDGRGHFVIGGQYYDSKKIGGCTSTRSWCEPHAIFQVDDSVRTPQTPEYVLVDNATAVPTRGGFISGVTGLQVPAVGPPIPSPFTAYEAYTDIPAALRDMQFNDAGTALIPRQTGDYISPNGQTMAGGEGLAHDAGTLLRVPVERYSFYTRFQYDFTDTLTGFAELNYGGRKSGRVQQEIQYALSGSATSSALIKADNAYLAAIDPSIESTLTGNGLDGFLLAKHPLDGALPTPTSDLDNNTFRIAAGLDGTLADRWTWDVYFTYGESNQDTTIYNARKDTRLSVNDTGLGRGTDYDNVTYAAVSPFDWALDAVVDPLDGQIKCRVNSSLAPAGLAANPNQDVRDLAAACVPLNLFGTGNIDPAAEEYAWGTITESVENDQTVLGGNIQGDLFDAWAGPVLGAAGFEYRKQNDSTTHGQVENYYAPDFGGDAVGELEVAEAYLETDITLLRDIPMVQNLSLNAAVRRTRSTASSRDVSKTFNLTTWKGTLVWNITDEFLIRGTRSSDIRAPGARELFFPGRTTAFFTSNPWSGESRDNIDILQNGGGNVDLAQEEADAYTLGFVFQPDGVLDGLRVSMDYYHIELVNGIAGVRTSGVVDACYNDPSSILCERITGVGDPVNGYTDIETIRTGSSNAEAFTTSGIDMELAYNLPLSNINSSWDSMLNFSILASYMDELVLESSDTGLAGLQNGVGINYAGQIGAGGVDDTASFSESPNYQWNGMVTYLNGSFRGTLQARYVGEGELYADLTGADQSGYQPADDNTITSNLVDNHITFNLISSYEFDTRDEGYLEVFGSVTNLFDKEPKVAPPIPPGGNGVTNPVFYDILGRRFNVGVRYNY